MLEATNGVQTRSMPGKQLNCLGGFLKMDGGLSVVEKSEKVRKLTKPRKDSPSGSKPWHQSRSLSQMIWPRKGEAVLCLMNLSCYAVASDRPDSEVTKSALENGPAHCTL